MWLRSGAGPELGGRRGPRWAGQQLGAGDGKRCGPEAHGGSRGLGRALCGEGGPTCWVSVTEVTVMLRPGVSRASRDWNHVPVPVVSHLPGLAVSADRVPGFPQELFTGSERSRLPVLWHCHLRGCLMPSQLHSTGAVAVSGRRLHGEASARAQHSTALNRHTDGTQTQDHR